MIDAGVNGAAVTGCELGESVVIVNVKGGGGTIGMKRVLKANPDGYTALFRITSYNVCYTKLLRAGCMHPGTLQRLLRTETRPQQGLFDRPLQLIQLNSYHFMHPPFRINSPGWQTAFKAPASPARLG